MSLSYQIDPLVYFRKFGYIIPEEWLLSAHYLQALILLKALLSSLAGFVVKGIYDNIKLESAEYDKCTYAGKYR